jgi:hypothetical protein
VRRVVGRRGGTLMLAGPQTPVSRMIDAAAAEAIPVYDSAGRAQRELPAKRIRAPCFAKSLIVLRY